MKILTWFLGLATIAALVAIGYYFVISQKKQPGSTETAKVTPSATPTASTLPSASPSPGASRNFSANQSLAQPNIIEAVPNGGNLASLAASHGVSTQDLVRVNGVSDANKIFVGQSLIVPDSVTNGTYLFLYILNSARQSKETAQLAAGSTSVYSDPITAAQADVKTIFGLAVDTPYSKSNETEKSVTLSTTDETKNVTIQLEKQADTLWLVKKVTVKLISPTPTPSPSP